MIQLKSIKFVEDENTPQEWTLSKLPLNKINLLVGKNASGKSRTLNVIHTLANMLAGKVKIPFTSGNYDCEFIWNNKVIKYQLKHKDEQVIKEVFTLDKNILLNRGKNGEGTIRAEQYDNEKNIRFQTPPNQLAVVARQDSIQHKYLEPLLDWGSSLRHFYFGSALGKGNFALVGSKTVRMNDIDGRDPNFVVALFLQAEKKYGDSFKKTIIDDMEVVGYKIENLGVAIPVTIRFTGTPDDPIGLFVKEKNLPGITDQHGMSQGMFRALSLLIHINYFQLEKKSSCLIIDDIGEGLDFDRSCSLIEVLREKVDNSETQLIMSTNDKFVMNRIPIEEWSVLIRKGNLVRVMNKSNSRKIFNEFKFSGLSNFSFLEMNFAGDNNEIEETM